MNELQCNAKWSGYIQLGHNDDIVAYRTEVTDYEYKKK